MPQPGFLWAPLQQSVRVVGGGALKKDGGLTLWVLRRVCTRAVFCDTFASAGLVDCVGDVPGRSLQMDLAVGSTSGGDLSVWGGCTLVWPEEVTCMVTCWDHCRDVGLERLCLWDTFTPLILGARQRILSELGVSVFVFVWVLCVCGLGLEDQRGPLCPSRC